MVFEDKDGNVLKTQVVDKDASATPPEAPAVEGYTFTGWEGNYTSVTQDEIVTAKYSKNAPVTYTVTFVDHDGSIIEAVIVESGSSATAPTAPTRDGYTFIGWDKAFDNVTSDMTVTALYEQNAVITDPTFVVGNATASNGDTVQIPISVVNNPGIASIVIQASYDESILTLSEVSFNDEIKGNTMISQTLTSPIELRWLVGISEVQGDFMFATLTFEVSNTALSNDETSIIVTYSEDEVYNLAEENIPFNIVNGKIVIK